MKQKQKMPRKNTEKKVFCNFIGCDAKFQKNGQLIVHERVHTGEKHTNAIF